MSLWQYFHHLHNPKDSHGKLSIPYATGMQCTPVFPVTPSYAKACLIKHKPWSKCNKLKLRSDGDAIKDYILFMDSKECPKILRDEYLFVKKNMTILTKGKSPQIQILSMPIEVILIMMMMNVKPTIWFQL